MHEVVSRFTVAVADEPARDKLGIGADRSPSPDITATLTAFICGNIALFAPNEIPNFIALDTLAGEATKRLILVLGTSVTEIDQKLHYRRAVNASHARSGAKGITLNQAGNYPRAFFRGNLVHKFKVALMLDRSSIMLTKYEKMFS